MSCEFESRVSLWIDGELPPNEEAPLKEHLVDCDSCRQLEQDFLRLGQVVRSYDPAPRRTATEALGSVMTAPFGGFWKRQVQVPLALAVAAMLALVSLGIWAAYRQVAPGRASASIHPALPAVEASGLDRFDRGERAVLYKVRDDRL